LPVVGGYEVSWIVWIIGTSVAAFGDPREELGRIVNFEGFHLILNGAMGYGDGNKGSRPPYDPAAIFKILIFATQNNFADARIEYLSRDRLSWLRFLGFDLGSATPDANTIRLFREKLAEAGALQVLFDAFDHRLRTNGYLTMGGQIVDATLMTAPRKRNTDAEKAAINEGKTADEIWPDQPAKAAPKDMDARRTVKFCKCKLREDGTIQGDIAIPSNRYKDHIAIDRTHGFIRRFKVTDGARHDSAMLREVVTRDNTGSDVWMDAAYRSKKHTVWLRPHGRISRSTAGSQMASDQPVIGGAQSTHLACNRCHRARKAPLLRVSSFLFIHPFRELARQGIVLKLPKQTKAND
jgi:transposase, IS5 family